MNLACNRQPHSRYATTAPLDHPCTTKGHDIPAQFLNIDVNLYQQAWVAFSQDAWTKTVLDEYKSEKRPAERFLKLDLAKLKTKPDGEQHAFELDPTLKRLSNGVEEYTKTAKDFGSFHGYDPRAETLGNVSTFVRRQKELHKGKIAAVVLMDADGVLQELNHARLKVITDIETWSKEPERARKHQTSEAIKALNILALEQAKHAVVKDTRYKPLTKTMSRQDYNWMRDSGQIPNGATFTPGKDKNGLPDYNSGTVTVTQGMIDAHVDKQGARRAKSVIERYQDRYKETDRKTFEILYQRALTAYNEDLKKYDADYSAWLSTPAWEITANDYQNNHTRSGAAFANKIGLALAGGGITDKSLAWWLKTLALDPTDPKNPVYAAIFGKQEKILSYLVPEKLPSVFTPKEMEETDSKKGGALYDTIKTLVATEITPDGKSAIEWSATKVAQLGQEGITQTQLALAGAITALDKNGKLTAYMEQISLRAYQASTKLYQKRDIALVTIRLTVEEYRHWLYEEVWGDSKKTFNQVSRAAKRKVRSVLERSILAIPDMQTRKTVIHVMVWTVLSAQEINTMLAAYRRGTVNNIDKVMRSVQAHAATLSQPITQAIGKLEGLSAKDMGNIMRALGAGTRNVHEPLFAGGAMYFQYWSLKQSMKDMQTKIGRDKQDALFGVVASSIGLLGSTVELAGATSGFGAAEKSGRKVFGKLLMRWGGAIAAATAVVDAGQSALAAVRTGKSGDTSAMWLYGGAAVALGIGAGVGINAALTSAALLGPVGIALALIILGIGLMYAARQAESTATENWLKRTVFGISDAQDKFPDPATEMTELNAVIIGLGIEMDFNDDWNQAFKGADTFNFRVKLPQFDPKLSAYEIVLDLQTDEKAAPIRYYQAHSLKTASASGIDLPTPKNIDGMMQISIDIPVSNAIKIAKARAVYWIDRMDPAMEMTTSLSVTD